MIPFEQLDITTMVMMVTFKGKLHLPLAFALFPVTPIEPVYSKKEILIPHSKIPGAILSMRYEGFIRGVQIQRFFRNAITITFSLKEKNVNVRLSSATIHICGIKKEEQCIETAEYIVNHVKAVEAEIKYVADHPEERVAVVMFLQENLIETTKGLKIRRHPSRIFDFFRWYLHEFTCKKDYLRFIEWLSNVKSIIQSEDFSVGDTRWIVVNINYNLGFYLNLFEFARLINRKNGFSCIYENAIQTCAAVKLPFIPEEGVFIKRVQKPYHKFQVYDKGSVTQSSPTLKSMKHAYELFMSTIEELRQQIERSN